MKHELLVEIANQPADHPVDEERIRQAVRDVLRAEKIAAAEVSVAIVDDPTIQALNARHLGHDWPTDVI
ncbi:MAG: rRNA maturation RNAse YbeY, partial [Planctomycetota bacterium]|nr:rRNA maturation RNAse YbeY [Planctomycetota bacterium]